jgi:hypothetical protein
LFTGDTTTADRNTFLGVAKPESLLKWVQDHPVKNTELDILYGKNPAVDFAKLDRDREDEEENER